jgi:hypothetical protein
VSPKGSEPGDGTSPPHEAKEASLVKPGAVQIKMQSQAQEGPAMPSRIEFNGEPGGARTRDHRIKSAMLYQLSYRLLV